MTEVGFALNLNYLDVLAAHGCRVIGEYPFGPAGVSIELWQQRRRGAIIATQADAPDGREWLHASIAYRSGIPTYDDLKMLHHAVFGRGRWAYQVFAPLKDHVNIHENALHLWGLASGEPVLPDFTYGKGTI